MRDDWDEREAASAWHVARAWPILCTLLAILSLFAIAYVIWLRPDAPTGVAPLLLDAPRSAPVDASAAPPLAIEQFVPDDKETLTPDQALARNLAMPLTPGNPAAPAFSADWLASDDLASATQCLATAIYYEAGGEPEDGKRAVAQVVLNRVRHPQYPKTVCEVVYQGAARPHCQFTFACDGSLARKPNPAGFRDAELVAKASLGGSVSLLAGQATHYHSIWVWPRWAPELRKVAVIGRHIFYRPPQAYGGYAVVAPVQPGSPLIATGEAPPQTDVSPVDGKPPELVTGTRAIQADGVPGPIIALTPPPTSGAMAPPEGRQPVPAPVPAPRAASRFGRERASRGSLPLADDH